VYVSISRGLSATAEILVDPAVTGTMIKKCQNAQKLAILKQKNTKKILGRGIAPPQWEGTPHLHQTPTP